MIAFMFVFSFRIEFIDFFVVFIEDGGARANLIFQAAATEGTAFPAPAVQAYKPELAAEMTAVKITAFIALAAKANPARLNTIVNGLIVIFETS